MRYFLIISFIFASLVTTGIIFNQDHLQKLTSDVMLYRNFTHSRSAQPIVTPTATDVSTDSPEISQTAQQPHDVQPKIIYAEKDDRLPWGVAQKVDDVTYTIRVGYDEQMTTPQELLEALNNYRAVHSQGSLAWDDRLAAYAQSRASYFNDIQGTDKHAGLNSFLEKEDGFAQLHFNRIGENSFYGGKLTGTHLIEWVFAQSPGHNANQLDPVWTHVGIGVTESSVNLNFGSSKF